MCFFKQIHKPLLKHIRHFGTELLAHDTAHQVEVQVFLFAEYAGFISREYASEFFIALQMRNMCHGIKIRLTRMDAALTLLPSCGTG